LGQVRGRGVGRGEEGIKEFRGRGGYPHLEILRTTWKANGISDQRKALEQEKTKGGGCMDALETKRIKSRIYAR